MKLRTPCDISRVKLITHGPRAYDQLAQAVGAGRSGLHVNLTERQSGFQLDRGEVLDVGITPRNPPPTRRGSPIVRGCGAFIR